MFNQLTGNFLSPLAKRAGQGLEQALFGSQTNERRLLEPSKGRPPIFSLLGDDAAHEATLRERKNDYRELDLERRENALFNERLYWAAGGLVLGVALGVTLAYALRR